MSNIVWSPEEGWHDGPEVPGKVYGLWHGGANYALGGMEHVEVFETVEDACIEAWNRWACGHTFACRFVGIKGNEVRSLCPVVDESSEIRVWFAEPDDVSDTPDRVIRYDRELGQFTDGEVTS